MSKVHLILLETSGCHLCELALAIVNEYWLNDHDVSITNIDIAEFPEWQPKYATRIPVLYHPETQQDLGWPFDIVDINNFMTGIKND
ncbi:glutaredoxin family protein [Crenothrix sp.]|uniref:glutaredoxin family protein n=1 Tax=Crenothrix sp. TaxID=3100433 RepID=UPI00374CD685